MRPDAAALYGCVRRHIGRSPVTTSVKCLGYVEVPDAKKTVVCLVTRCGGSIKGYGSSTGVASNGGRIAHVGQSINCADVEGVLPGLALIGGCSNDGLGAGSSRARDHEINAAGSIHCQSWVALAGNRIRNRANRPSKSIVVCVDDHPSRSTAIVIGKINRSVGRDFRVTVQPAALSGVHWYRRTPGRSTIITAQRESRHQVLRCKINGMIVRCR